MPDLSDLIREMALQPDEAWVGKHIPCAQPNGTYFVIKLTHRQSPTELAAIVVRTKLTRQEALDECQKMGPLAPAGKAPVIQ